jgi:hypothetical protein
VRFLFHPLVVALTAGILVPEGPVAARPTPSVSVTPSTIDFGSVEEGEVSSQPLVITNTGRAPIKIGGYGVEAGPFTFDDAMCALVGRGALLLPGRTCTMTVTAQTFNFPPGGIFYFSPGTYEGAFYMIDVEDVELVRVPLTVTIAERPRVAFGKRGDRNGVVGDCSTQNHRCR